MGPEIIAALTIPPAIEGAGTAALTSMAAAEIAASGATLTAAEIAAASTGMAAMEGAALTATTTGMSLGTKVALTGMALSAGTAGYQGYAQNKATTDAASRAAAAQNDAIAVGQEQVGDQASLEKQKVFDEAQQLKSRIRVAAGESGMGTGSGTAKALTRQADFDTAKNFQIIGRNKKNNIKAIRSGGKARIAGLERPSRNPLLEGMMNGVQGFGSGLYIGNNLR